MGDKACRVHYKQVLDVVAPIPFVQYRRARVFSHATSTSFMSHASQRVGRYLLVREEFGAGGLQDCFDLSVHFVEDREGVVVFGAGVKAHLRYTKPIS